MPGQAMIRRAHAATLQKLTLLVNIALNAPINFIFDGMTGQNGRIRP
jgi:hypothetical protein